MDEVEKSGHKPVFELSLGAEALEEISLEVCVSRRVEEIEAAEKEIQDLEDALQEKNGEAVTLLEALRAELEALMRPPEPHAARKSIEEIIAETAAHNKRMEEGTESGKKNPSSRAKELFAKIAQKTHPDKTEDAEKHRLFEFARRAKDRNDVKELAEILRALGIKAGLDFSSNFVSKLQFLREQDTKTKKKLENILSSQHYKVAVDYRNPSVRPYVQQHYARILSDGAEKLKAEIRKLDPKRHVQEAKRSSFFGSMFGI